MTIQIEGTFTQRTEYALRLPDGTVMERDSWLMPTNLEQAERIACAEIVQKSWPGAVLVTRAVLISEWIEVPGAST